jgi:glutaredoxin
MTVSILVYSNYCAHCKKILKLINNLPIKHSIKYVCIDKASVRSKIPTYVKSVPCIIVGDTNQLLVGTQIIQWINHQPTSVVSNQSQEMNHKNHSLNSKPQYPQNPQQNTQNKESTEKSPNPFLLTEMGMFSDNYSFIDADTGTQGNGGKSISHNFEFLNNDSGREDSGGSLPGNSRPGMPIDYATNGTPDKNSYGAVQNKVDMDEMTSLMEKRMSARHLDVESAPRRV